MADSAHFPPATFRFLKELAANNRRDWFAENKPRYGQDALQPAVDFIAAFAPRLRKISANFRADSRPVGGSLFRIYRDTRFAKDKSPYKTFLGIQFRHERGKDAHCPGFYLHVAPGDSFVGVGLWHPQGPVLQRLRQAIVDDPAAWKRASRGKRFREHFELGGDSLKRAPRGFDADHPLIDDLRRKDFIGVAPLTTKQLTSTDFLATFDAQCRAGAPLVRWLCAALDVPF